MKYDQTMTEGKREWEKVRIVWQDVRNIDMVFHLA